MKRGTTMLRTLRKTAAVNLFTALKVLPLVLVLHWTLGPSHGWLTVLLASIAHVAILWRWRGIDKGNSSSGQTH
jgi:hypothetical protein